MKHYKSLLIILFFMILLIPQANANQKIAFLNVEFILTQSKSGKYLNSNIKELQQKKLTEFKKKKEDLENDEKKLITQKNILEPSKFEEQVKVLRTNIIDFNNEKKITFDNLNKKKIVGTNIILKELDPILKEYATKNSISIILQKKYILLGKNDIDITQDILKLLDKKIQKINLD